MQGSSRIVFTDHQKLRISGQQAFASEDLLKRHNLSARSRGPSQFDAAQPAGSLLVSVGT